MTITDFSAKEPSLGYYYQIRYSLYLLLKCRTLSSPTLKLECLDDIEVIDDEKMLLFQTKLHIKTAANLTDSSTDFWKTIRVWSEGIINADIDPASTIFTLITTAKIGETSFLMSFKDSSDKDSEEILEKMIAVATTSTSSANEKAYKAFLLLDKSIQILLIDNISIIDNEIDLEEAKDCISRELRYSTESGKMDPFIERLEGWWFDKCIMQLVGNITGITSIELQQKVSDIRDSFKSDNLPDDFSEPLDITDDIIDNHAKDIFIKQLSLINMKSSSIRNAISDYRRAYEQRSKWIREDLLSPTEAEKFEKNLFDNWNNIFSLIEEDSDGKDASELTKIGNNFYKDYYVKRVPPIKIRERFQAEYLTRGSCHLLADKLRIGWHPKFRDLI